MPYPESCPECGGAFRNTGTHFTARRNEVGRHVLLELGCQANGGRFWWNFSTGQLTNSEGRAVRATPPARAALVTVATNGASNGGSNGATNGTSNGATNGATNGHAAVATLEPPAPPATNAPPPPTELELSPPEEPMSPVQEALVPPSLEDLAPPPPAPAALKDAFVRQLQLDRLTLRQMRSWLMADDARRAIEVAAGATEATYERLALILFGTDLPQLLGRQTSAPAPQGMSAEERLELQREKARIRARLRRAAIKAAKQSGG
jgi:hypothetical protein